MIVLSSRWSLKSRSARCTYFPIPYPAIPAIMSEIQAFRGIRYNLGQVGSLSDVVSPPYDVIGPEFLDELYKMHPCNFVRIDFNRIEPGDDDEANNRYTRAARVPEELARRRRAHDRSRSGHLHLLPGLRLRRHDLHPPRISWPGTSSRSSAKARSSRTRKPCPPRRSIG